MLLCIIVVQISGLICARLLLLSKKIIAKQAMESIQHVDQPRATKLLKEQAARAPGIACGNTRGAKPTQSPD